MVQELSIGYEIREFLAKGAELPLYMHFSI